MAATSDIRHKPKLLEQVVARLRVKHYSLRTDKTYSDWIKRCLWFHGKRYIQRASHLQIIANSTGR
jgi:hypothetical protein